MKLEVKNKNYCFNVVKVGLDIPLEGRDKIVHKNIYGNMVITQKELLPEGSLALYIPVECQLSEDYCKYNNLYDKSDMNTDPTKKGYISYKKRRIKALKLGGFESNGMLMPLHSLSYLDPYLKTFNIHNLKEGDEFDTIDNIELCRKYEIQVQKSKNLQPKGKQPKRISKVVDGQFRFHQDTTQLGKNIHNINPEDIISITYKLHGTSAISSKILVKRKLSLIEKIAKKLGVKVQETHYDDEGIYASRKVVKNKYLNTGAGDYYGDSKNWRRMVHDIIFHYLSNGMTAYYEIVGYTPGGKMIQKGFDYGCEQPPQGKDRHEFIECGDSPAGKLYELVSNYQFGKHFKAFIYRLTYTNSTGQVFEFSAKQVQDWCKMNNLEAVPELYYGKLNECVSFSEIPVSNTEQELLEWRDLVLEKLKNKYWYKQCTMCSNKVPSEGVVVRKEGLGFEAYKYKNFDFLIYEGKQLDKEETNAENNEEI